MKYISVFSLLFLVKITFGYSAESPKVFLYQNSLSEETMQIKFQQDSIIILEDSVIYQPKHRKLKAVLLAVFLGHFGVHRIYLGTKANVPVVYTLTLGGGFGLLPLMDIIAILSSKDLSKFENNNKVIMWVK